MDWESVRLYVPDSSGGDLRIKNVYRKIPFWKRIFAVYHHRNFCNLGGWSVHIYLFGKKSKENKSESIKKRNV